MQVQVRSRGRRDHAGARRIVSGMTTTLAARAVDATRIHGSSVAPENSATTVTALDHVSLDIERGTFTAIMGPSGSGKSTLLHCLAGLDRLSSGAVFIGDVELGRLRERALTTLRRDRIGFVFQAYNLLPALNARENITLPLDIAGRRPDAAWLATVIEAVGLADRLTHRPSQLSGRQWVEILSAIAVE
jgi:putative ABC transport system ATP-binding protein